MGKIGVAAATKPGIGSESGRWQRVDGTRYFSAGGRSFRETVDPESSTAQRLASLVSIRPDLPSRAVFIAGLEGRLAARILSKDLSGPAIRLVTFEGDLGLWRRRRVQC